jgi:hypothetical protein
LRWDLLFPVQYDAGLTRPTPDQAYTHAPLGLHAHTTLSVWLFGDSPAAVRAPSALYSILVLLMLVAFVKRHYSRMHALIAGAVYVALPINAIYLNMVNHQAGGLFWCLVSAYAYLEYREARYGDGREQMRSSRRWLLATGAAFFFASWWEYFANYLGLGIAVHWFFSSIARRGDAGAWWRPPGRDLGPFVLWCIYVPGLVFAHFALVHWYVGSLDELAHTASNRADVSWSQFWGHLGSVPGIVFGWSTLAMAGLWLLSWPYRWLRGRGRDADVLALSLGFGGVLHYVVFKSSAIVHSYWGWVLLPTVSIALACWVVGLGTRIMSFASGRGWGRRQSVAAVGLSALLLLPLAIRSATLVPGAREVGGSLWFVAPVRGPVWEVYQSGRTEMRLANQIREWTDRETGVLVHRSIEQTTPEPRFYTALDRYHRAVQNVPSIVPTDPSVSGGWVFVAASSALPTDTWNRLAAEYAYKQFGDYIVIDFREEGPRVEIWDLEEAEPSFVRAFLVSPFETRLEPVRQPAAEAGLLRRLE